ncbi:MAG: RsmB/NOP family class I SAM-dependent RNA methyltransferase, partial [Pseudomonadota bacterium]
MLDDIIHGDPAERALTRWSRRSRFAGSKDRAAVRDLVFDTLRRRSSAFWVSGASEETGRALILGLLTQSNAEGLAALGDGVHAPPAMDAGEAAALRTLDGAPRDVASDMPGFLLDAWAEGGLSEAQVDAEVAVLRNRAPVDLRVNSLRATRDEAQASLVAEGIETEHVASVPTALRVLTQPRKVASSQAYRDGWVELQDSASQHVASVMDPKPGERVLDLCAGGGGKTLALAAKMGPSGQIIAFDINPARMRDLPARAARAGANVVIADDALLSQSLGMFDRILVDTPCSGTGAFRRNPDQKWRITPSILSGLVRTQADILDRAQTLLRPGGQLIYATCSSLWCENEAQPLAALDRWQ